MISYFSVEFLKCSRKSSFGKKNLTEEKIDFEEDTGDKVLNDEVELVDEEEGGEDDDGDDDDAEGDKEEDDEEGEEVMDFYFYFLIFKNFR